MKAPDKIYVHRTVHLGFLSASEMDITGQDEQYIRKDTLLEWAKEKRNHYHERGNNIADISNPDMPFFNGKENAFKELINRIESL